LSGDRSKGDSASGSARLVLESSETIDIVRDIGGQELDRDVTAEPLVDGPVYQTHPAFADAFDDAESVCEQSSADGLVGHGEGVDCTPPAVTAAAWRQPHLAGTSLDSGR
jgi:hypothetical protein